MLFRSANFIIPKPTKKSILMSKKLQGGVLMDMGPYISAIPRLFNLKRLVSKKIEIKKNRENSRLIARLLFMIIF